MAEEEDEVQLSAETMKALQEFLQEQSDREIKIKEITEQRDKNNVSSLTFGEDWQLSQFWYSDETAISLAKVAISVATSSGRIALISCPTLYRHIKSLAPEIKVSLFEFDQRFSVFGEDFFLYDYRSPLDIPRDFASQFDIVVMDPPFLSEECLTKTAVTAKFLAKDKIILCTGSVMEDLARRLLDMKKCLFEPKHQNNLANEFCCYSNFNFDDVLSTVNKNS
ncbi:EEF1A lysine methyltransferase 1 [Macrosteles quadrilineatus]|uniref:EEF1A lysine methyltransferase 1 n=1 Tax=Macrosteles quadrilineatus TaxID=74068 RepID=UPI0023E283C2|nr:EEF1A lysine methyltransferase 1 [Macrosteles quadrilineatus]